MTTTETPIPEAVAQTSGDVTPKGMPTAAPGLNDGAAQIVVLAKVRLPRLRAVKSMLEAQNRERIKVLQGMVKIRGLMPLLMKKRNGQVWSAAERADLMEQLRAVAHVSPYLVVVLLPGSFAMLPVLAWWLDRRRQDRDKGLAV